MPPYPDPSQLEHIAEMSAFAELVLTPAWRSVVMQTAADKISTLEREILDQHSTLDERTLRGKLSEQTALRNFFASLESSVRSFGGKPETGLPPVSVLKEALQIPQTYRVAVQTASAPPPQNMPDLATHNDPFAGPVTPHQNTPP